MTTTSKPKQTKPRVKRSPSVVLTEKQNTYVEARLDGKSKTDAAKQAGYDVTSVQTIEKSEDVKQALSQARSELSSAVQIKRFDVIEMFKEAYDMAKLSAEPGNMVAAAREIGKMLGYYEAEKIKVELSMSQANMQKKFEIMSDEELMEIAEGRARIVEGEYVRLS